ncbi:hypothetical protein [Halobacillus sp. H74]|uniref:hypothetical protein n=1 Tax=Halobacillus sp. H74 TaxID=3457436 RepID=UPI003FCC367D
MGIYQTLCYKAEDAFVKIITKDKNKKEVEYKVHSYRENKETIKRKKKEEAQARIEEKKKQQELKEEQERKEVMQILTKFVDLDSKEYTIYEFNEVKKNKTFFTRVLKEVFEDDEQGLTFVQCEFDKTKKQEIKGYLLATTKRVWFVSKDLRFNQKFRYQTIKSVSSFKDSLIEKGILVQYGTKKLEFDEIFENEQLQKFINTIRSNTP